MIDGMYQSVITFYMSYFIFAPSNFETDTGLNLNDNARMGVFIASAAVVVVNFYVLFNTYRWDWLIVLIVVISTLLIWFWTGVWTASTAGFTFYKGAPQVYGALSFWALLLLTVIICLLPRFAGKSYQKIYRPRDVDIIREQVRQGRFDYLDDPENHGAPPASGKPVPSSSSSDSAKAHTHHRHRSNTSHVTDDLRPIYPRPSRTR